MQRALERSNPHRRHIAELTNGINLDYVNKLRSKSPVHFGGLKKELIQRYEGGALVKPSSYQGDVIRAFSSKNGMPKPDMHFTPDTLSVGKSIRFDASMPSAKTSEYKALKNMGNMELGEDINQLNDEDYGLSSLYGQGIKKRLIKKRIKKVIKKIK